MAWMRVSSSGRIRVGSSVRIAKGVRVGASVGSGGLRVNTSTRRGGVSVPIGGSRRRRARSWIRFR